LVKIGLVLIFILPMALGWLLLNCWLR